MSNLATGSPVGAVASLAGPVARGRRLDVRPVAWVLLLGAALFVLDYAGWYGAITDQPIRIATQVLTFAVIGSWLAVAIARPRWLPHTPLVAPVLAAAAVFAVAGLFSQRSRLSLEATLAGLAAAALFLFLARLAAEPWFRTRLRVVLVLIPVVVAVAYVVQVLLTWLEFWGLAGAIGLPPLRPDWAGLVFGSPNLIATVLMLTGPLALAFIRERRPRVAMGAGLLFTLAIVLSGSRSALVGLGLAALVGAWVLLQRRGGIRSLGSRRLAAGAVAVACAVAVAVPIFAFRLAQGGELLRLDLWRSALSIVSAHPLLGGGPGTWVQLKVAANPDGATNLIVAHAHDLFVQTLAEVGILGSLVLILVVVAVVRRLMKAARADQGALGTEALAVVLALVAFAGQSLTDNLVNLPAVVLLLLLIVAWVEGGLVMAARAPDSGERASPAPGRALAPSRWLARSVAAAALVGLIASAVPLATFDRAALAADDGNRAAATGDWTTAEARYGDAAALDPDMTLYQLERGVALARLGRTADARPVLEAAATQDQLAINWISLAALDAQAGDCPAAMRHAGLAVDRGSNDAGVALNAGAVAERCGSSDEAHTWFVAALAAMPALAADPYWQQPVRAAERASLVADARSRLITAGDPADAAILSAYAGDTGTATAELAALPTPCITCDAQVRYLAGDQAGAVAMLKAQLAAHPLDWQSAIVLSRYAWFAGNDAGAVNYQRMAEIVQGDVTPGMVTAPNRIQVDAPGGQLLPADYPWAVYLRNGPVSFWVPELLTPVFAR